MSKSRGLHPYKPRQRWTDDEDETLRRFYTTPQTIEEIAAVLNRSVGAVWQRAQTLNLERKPRSDFGSADVQRVCECCGEAFTVIKSEIRLRPARYCSPKCTGFSQRNTIYAQIIEDNSIPEPMSGCWLWLGAINGAGYGALSIGNKQWHAHRLSYFLANGEMPDDAAVIRHLCNNPSCVNPIHLASGTTYDNAQDRVAAGTQVKGSQHPLAKLSEADVPHIVAASRAGVGSRALAARFGVSQRAIDFVLRGVTWRHASGL